MKKVMETLEEVAKLLEKVERRVAGIERRIDVSDRVLKLLKQRDRKAHGLIKGLINELERADRERERRR